MTLMLGAFASSLLHTLRVLSIFLVLLVLSVLVVTQAVSAQEVVSAQPIAQPVYTVPTITLWREGAVISLIVILIGCLIWRVSLIEAWVRSDIRFHTLAASWLESELEKRGVQVRPPAPKPDVPPMPPLPLTEDDHWAAEADRAAPPPPAKPTNVRTISTREMAHKLTARGKVRGNA